MLKQYTSKGFTYSDEYTKAVFCPRENILKVLENQKKMKENIEKNIQGLEADLAEIAKA